MRATSRIFALLLSIWFCLAASSPPLASGQTLKVGYTSKTIFFLPFFVAQRKGFYEAEHLRVELILMGTPAINLQALIAGQIQISNINPDGIIIANERGANLRAIAGVINGVAYSVIAGKRYKKIEELKGTKLGVGSLKGGPTTLLLEYLRAKGLTYPRDYTLVLVGGGTPARLAALESNSIAAAVIGVPQSDMAVDQGFNRLGDVLEVLPTFQFTTVNVDRTWAEKNRPLVVRFLKAHIRALRWTHDHIDDASEILSKETNLNPFYARKGVEYFTKNKLFPRNGEISMDGMKVNIEVQAKDGLLNPPLPSPEKQLELGFLRQAQSELKN